MENQKKMPCNTSLPEIHAAIIRGIYFFGKTERQLSDELDIPKSSINVKKQNALKVLKKYL